MLDTMSRNTEPTLSLSIRVDLARFDAACRATIPHLSLDESRPGLMQVRVEVEGRDLVLIGTNGHSLAACRMRASGDLADGYVGDVRADDLWRLAQQLRAAAPKGRADDLSRLAQQLRAAAPKGRARQAAQVAELVLAVADGILSVIWPGGHAQIRLRPPSVAERWRDVMPKESRKPAKDIGVASALLARGAESAHVYLPDEVAHLQLGDEGDPIHLWAATRAGDARIDVLVMPSRL